MQSASARRPQNYSKQHTNRMALSVLPLPSLVLVGRGWQGGKGGRTRCIFICVITLAHFQTTISACWQLWLENATRLQNAAQTFQLPASCVLHPCNPASCNGVAGSGGSARLWCRWQRGF